MKIASCLLDLYLPNSHSLKEKRQVIKSMKDSLRNHFNISIAELDHQNLWQRATLGIALISPDSKSSNEILTKILKAIEEDLRVEVLHHEIEFH